MKRIASLWVGSLLAVCSLWAQAPPPQQPSTAPASTTPVAKQPAAKSQKEMEAVMAIFQAADPDARIKAADALLSNFADTEFKAVALQVAALTYQEKNDFENMVIYAERSLEADPNSFQAMILLAAGFAQRTREHDLDKEEKLAKAEKYANRALEILKTAPRPRADITDEQWEGAKKDISAQAYEALGLAAMVRKKYDEAINQLKTAVNLAVNQDPATKIRLAAAYNFASKYDEAVTLLDALLSDPQLHPTIRQFAQSEKMKALQGKEAKK